jgi:hypothetical protein
VADDVRVRQRAVGIISVVVLGSVQQVELPLVFSSLMSLYFGIEKSSAGYIAMATSLLETLGRRGSAKKDELELLGSVVEPMLAVGDSACSTASASFLRFLKRVAQSGDDESAEVAMGLMVHFATPKQGFVGRKSG